MIKILLIERCGVCPAFQRDMIPWCGHEKAPRWDKQGELQPMQKPPKWCPLPDVKDDERRTERG